MTELTASEDGGPSYSREKFPNSLTWMCHVAKHGQRGPWTVGEKKLFCGWYHKTSSQKHESTTFRRTGQGEPGDAISPSLNFIGWNLACNSTRHDPAVLLSHIDFALHRKKVVSSFPCDWGNMRFGFPEHPLWLQKRSGKPAASPWETLVLEISAYLLEGSSSRSKISLAFFFFFSWKSELALWF